MNLNRLPLAGVALAVLVAACTESQQPAPQSTASAIPDSITLIEEVRKESNDDYTIPYKKYELDFLLFGYGREPYLSLAKKNEPMTFRSIRARRKAAGKK